MMPAPPVYEQTKSDEGVIDLSEPSYGGWLDAITPESEELLPEQRVSAGTSAPYMDQTYDQAFAQEGSSVEASATTLQPPQTNISIQINMPNLPKLHWPKFKLPVWPYRRVAIWVAIGTGSLAVLVGVVFLAKHFVFMSKVPLSVSEGAASLSGQLTTPTFVPVAPKNKPYLAQGKSQATAFDGKRDSYSFTDTLENVPLTVSEQPVPANFASASQAVTTIAKSLGATHTLQTHGLVAYEAKSDKSATQTIILVNNDILIFIQSNFPHDDGTWEGYIDSLQQPAS
jgi:hypothetical protein